MENTERPRMWLCVLVGAVLGLVVPPFALGLFQVAGSNPALMGGAPMLGGAACGWLWCRIRRRAKRQRT